MTTTHFALMVAFVVAGSFSWQIKMPSLVYAMTGYALVIGLDAVLDKI